MELKFYNRPFHQPKYGGWVYDAKSNFVFQFDEVKKYDEKGNYLNGLKELGIKELRQEVIFSLNALDNEHIEGLELSINPKDPTEIYNKGKSFIRIRGWGNLTGIGGYNFDLEKASKIQDDFRDWIIYKLTQKK
jgi:hypothetical protein